MKKSPRQTFIDNLRIPKETSQNSPDTTKNISTDKSEEELMQMLEKKFDELFDPLDDN